MYRLVDGERASHHLATLCRVLGASRSGYHAWARGPARRRATADARLSEVIADIHATSRATYGAPRVHAGLQARGFRVGRKRVARLMREAGLVGVHHRRRRKPIRRPAHRAWTTAPDLVRRRFRATAPDRLWVADVTELPTHKGAVYLAAIVDVFSRACIGWSMADHLRDESRARRARRGPSPDATPGPGLIHHSDRGTQYTSMALGGSARPIGRESRRRWGTCPARVCDNALAESFLRVARDRAHRSLHLANQDNHRHAVFDWIERFYNRVFGTAPRSAT